MADHWAVCIYSPASYVTMYIQWQECVKRACNVAHVTVKNINILKN